MTTDRENIISIALFVALVGALIAGMCWHASIVDRAADRHYACLSANKANGLSTRAAHDACVAQGIGHAR